MDTRKELADAIRNEQTKKVSEILNKHPELLNEGLDEDGCPALHIAVKKDKLEMARMLLQIPGIDIYASDKFGKPAFRNASKSNVIYWAYLLDLISEFESSNEFSSLTKERLEYLKKNDGDQDSLFYILRMFTDTNLGAIAAFTKLQKNCESFNPDCLSHYLLAILYRLGKGTSCNTELAKSYFFKAYQGIQEREKIKTNKPFLFFFNTLKERIISSVESYFVSCDSNQDRHKIAKICFDIFLAEKNIKKCREYLNYFESNPPFIEKSYFVAEKYYLLSQLSNNPDAQADLSYAINAKYGPAFIEKAKQALNQTPSNFIEAINYYSEAITTESNPLEKDGMEGIQASIKQLDLNTLKTPEVMKTLIMNGIKLKFQKDKQDSYKAYCKMNLMPKNILTNIIMENEGKTMPIENFIRVLVGANTYLADNNSSLALFFSGESLIYKKLVIRPDEKNSIIQTAEAILRELLTSNFCDRDGIEKIKILTTLALLQSNPIESLEFNNAFLQTDNYNFSKNQIIWFLKKLYAVALKKEPIQKLWNNKDKWPTFNKSNPQIEPDPNNNNNLIDTNLAENNNDNFLYPDLHFEQPSAPPYNPQSDHAHSELATTVTQLQQKMDHVIVTLAKTQQDLQQINAELTSTRDKLKTEEEKNQNLEKQFEVSKAQRRLLTMFPIATREEVININQNKISKLEM